MQALRISNTCRNTSACFPWFVLCLVSLATHCGALARGTIVVLSQACTMVLPVSLGPSSWRGDAHGSKRRYEM